MRHFKHSSMFIGLLFMLMTMGTGCDKKKGNTTPSSNNTEIPPVINAAWSELDPAQFIQVNTQSPQPTFKRQDFSWTPNLLPEGTKPGSWKTNTKDGVSKVSLETTFAGRPLDASWTMTQGDPQALWQVRLDKIELPRLAQPIEFTTTLPPGELTYLDSTMSRRTLGKRRVTLHSWDPQWIQWRSGKDVITFSGWSVDHLTLTANDKGGVDLTFALWSPQQHPPVSACEVQGRSGLSLAHHMLVSFGTRHDLSPARLPSGFEAAIVPVFKHASGAKAPNASDWNMRVQTLLHGHSDKQDPRHGNGGLAGTNLGGSIVYPSDLGDISAKTLKNMPASINAVHDRPPRGSDEAGAFVAQNFPCKAVLGRRKSSAQHILVELQGDHDGRQLNSLAQRTAYKLGDRKIQSLPPAFVPGLPAHLVMTTLQANKRMLTDQMLSTAYLQQLRQSQGIAWFAVPLVATRNPLSQASKTQLLAPERQGHWTLDATLAKSLGALELAQEERTVTSMSIRKLIAHKRAMDALRLHELPNGSLEIHNPGPEITGATFVTPTASTIVINGEAAANTKTVTLKEGTTQTWFWLNLPKGKTTLNTQEGQALGLPPTQWVLK